VDLLDAEKRLTPKTKAIMPVHYGGGVGQLDEIYSFAKNYGLRVIEDAAHAFGTLYKGKRIGNFGDISCFSFDGIKNITSGEGGCIVTNNESILQHVRDARLLGIEKDTDNRYSHQRSWEFDVKNQGWRYHMSNIMAAIGRVQLKRFHQFANNRQLLAQRYYSHLKNHPRIQLLSHDYNSVVPHIFVIAIKDLTDRKSMQSRLLKHGIQTGIHYQPNHKLSFFYDASALPLPTTDTIFSELLTLPLHAEMTENDVTFVCQKLIELV
jgi:dTDP-4-amino-4,6-dideoxygalactose transaminase